MMGAFLLYNTFNYMFFLGLNVQQSVTKHTVTASCSEFSTHFLRVY